MPALAQRAGTKLQFFAKNARGAGPWRSYSYIEKASSKLYLFVIKVRPKIYGIHWTLVCCAHFKREKIDLLLKINRISEEGLGLDKAVPRKVGVFFVL